MDTLITQILSTRRCHNSKGELLFVAWLRETLEGLKCKVHDLAEGCILVHVGVPKQKILFSCHVDTCHSMAESDGTPQKLFYDSGLGHIFLDKSVQAGCLGADDGAGVYILLKMIEAKVPGSYIFHRGEEKGGVGARAVLAKHYKDLEGYGACIAFDRPNNDEVIVSQGGQQCASVAYGQALCDLFKGAGLAYEVSHKGVFTDSKVYRGVIKECLNIGVGYGMQHTSNEYQDWGHLEALTEACCNIDWQKLKPSRVCPIEPPMRDLYSTFSNGAYVSPSAKRSKDSYEDLYDETPDDGYWDFEEMSREEIDEITGDEGVTLAVMNVLVDLAAEKAKVEKYKQLLGLT